MKMYHYLLMWLYNNHIEVFHEWAQYLDGTPKQTLEEECIVCKEITFSKGKEICLNCGSSMNLWSEEE